MWFFSPSHLKDKFFRYTILGCCFSLLFHYVNSPLHSLIICMVSEDKSFSNFYPCSSMGKVFPLLPSFKKKILFLSLVFELWMWYLWVFYILIFILLVFLQAFWVCGLVSFINFRVFLAITASDISFGLFSLLIWHINATHYQIISEFFDVLFYLFQYCFFVFYLRKFLLMCPQVDWFCVECTKEPIEWKFHFHWSVVDV